MRAAAAAAVVCAAALVLLVTLAVRPERVALEGKAARARGARPTARSIELTAKTALKQLEGKTKSKNAPLPASAASAAQVISASVKAALSELAGKPTASPSQAAADVAARADAKAAKRVKSGAPTVEPGPPAVSATEVHKIMKSMVKAAAAKKKAKEARESKTDRMQDRILQAKNRLASMKLKKSKDFAAYEKSDEEVDDAKSRALEAHDEYREDKERERVYKKRLAHLQQKLANHLTGQHARSDLNSYYAQLNAEAVKSIPQKIRDADKLSSREAARYKRIMEHHKELGERGRNAERSHDHKMDVKKTVALKQFPQVNVWDTSAHKVDVVEKAEKKLRQESKAADREILKTEEAKARKPSEVGK
jgi:hypothetical protein